MGGDTILDVGLDGGVTLLDDDDDDLEAFTLFRS